VLAACLESEGSNFHRAEQIRPLIFAAGLQRRTARRRALIRCQESAFRAGSRNLLGSWKSRAFWGWGVACRGQRREQRGFIPRSYEYLSCTTSQRSPQRVGVGSFRSQNHRIVGVGRDLCGSSSPTLLSVAELFS